MEVNVKKFKYEMEDELKKGGIESAAFEASLILTGLCGLSKFDLAVGNKTINGKNAERVKKAVSKRISGYPLQYILGEWEFMSLPFKVTEDTLIPRADTEVLCETGIEFLKDKYMPKVLDLCCGSGCIGISVAYYVKNAYVTLVELSDGAIDVAKKNCGLNGVSDRTEVKKDNVMCPKIVYGAYDLILSNPPYIPASDIDSLSSEVHFEPPMALDGGKDGLDFYRAITANYAQYLRLGGMLAFEAGIGQSDMVADILTNCNFSNVKIIKDLCGVNRVVLGYKK
jgi:release factor glutamine methyltransferase